MSINQFDLLETIVLSRALFTAAEFNLAEHLEHGPQSLATLATLTGADAATLARLLYFLCLKNIFTREQDGTYSLPTDSHHLLEHHLASIKPFLLHDDETRWNSFGHLSYSIKTGKPAFDMLYGHDYFTSLKKNPVLSERFDKAMNSISSNEDTAIARQLIFNGKIADIGGGNGQLLREILSNQSAVSTAILFDLPNVVELVQNTPKLQCIGGSFFEPLNIDTETLILKRILHDWTDEQALAILHQVAATMTSESELVIIEGIFDKAEQPSILAAIDLLLLSIFGGKERTLEQFNTLITRSGLTISKIISITPILSGIYCRKQ